MVQVASNKKIDKTKMVFETRQEAIAFKQKELFDVVPLERLKEILSKR